MLADLMPRWLFTVLRMDSAKPSDAIWTWRHTCRYGFDVCPPTAASNRPLPTPWLFRGNNGQLALMIACVGFLAWLWS